MGILDKFRGRSSQAITEKFSDNDNTPMRDGTASAHVELTLGGPSVEGLVKLSGTTTFGKDAMSALLARHPGPGRGMLFFNGVLQREPSNPVDPDAVGVFVEGERIGYLPSHVAKVLSLSVEGAATIPLQVFYIRDAGMSPRAEAWGWLGSGSPEWQYSEASPPPLTASEKRLASQAVTNQMVEDALQAGGDRGRQVQDGVVNGIHFLQAVEPIKQLKRENRLDEALTLCYLAIEGAERARDGRDPAPWYTEQAAIIHRKLGQHAEEIEVLRRWMSVAPERYRDGSSIAARLRKLEGGQ